MSSLCDTTSVFDGRTSNFATMRHTNRVFSDPAIALHHSTSTTPPSFGASKTSLTRNGGDIECRSVPVTPMKSMSSNQISRMPPPPPPPPPSSNRFSAPLLGQFYLD